MKLRHALLILVIAAICCIGIFGCDKVTMEEFVEARTEEAVKLSCHHPGICHRCVPRMKSRGGVTLSCGYHYSTLCPGSQRADVEVRTYRITHESGKQKLVASRHTIRTLEECK